MEKRESQYTVGGNINRWNYYGKSMEVPHRTFVIKLPYNPAIPLLGIYLKKMKTLIREVICISMFIAALFTITKIRKQSSVHQQMNG